jgi:hypothetical protein
MVGATVWDSERFLALESDSSRLSYLYLCANPHGNSVGVYKMPARYLSADRRQTLKEAERDLNALQEVGLIEVGQEDQIRITRWFDGPSGANSPSTGSNFAKVFMDTSQVRRGDLRFRAAMEMLFSTLVKSRSWNPETKQISQMQADFSKLLAALLREDHESCISACNHLGLDIMDTVWDTMWQMVCSTMPHTVRTYIHEHLTPEMDTERDTGHRTPDTGHGESPRANDRRSASSPPTSPPANGGRSAGKTIPKDVQDDIDALKKKRDGAGKDGTPNETT